MLNTDNDSEDKFLELVSAFAFDSKKYLHKKINYGEGLIGTCAIEKSTIYLKEVPEEYISITSGLGEAPPRNILIVPIKLEDEILGVLEIASFNIFEPHQIEFVEKIMESVASTLSSAKINAKTNELLKMFENQSKEMEEKEDEMQQTIEELQATQEESAYKEYELQSIIDVFTQTSLIVEYNTEGIITNVSNKYAELLGVSKSAIIGKTYEDAILKEEDKLIIKNRWEEIVEGKGFNTKTCYQAINNVLCFENQYLPVKNRQGSIIKIIKVSKDISLQERYKEKLDSKQSDQENDS